MDIRIQPQKLRGSITPPPSKSQAHRLIMAAALAEGESRISNVAFSQDILATLSCVEQLGAVWKKIDQSTITIDGLGKGKPILQSDRLVHFDCGESGSTLRFLIPIALAVAGGGVFTGHGRLMERPQKPYFDVFDKKGISYQLQDGSLTVCGTLKSGEYALAGNVSSQFFTGLLYALPYVDGTSLLRSTTALESQSYIDMTIDALQKCGIAVEESDGEYPVFKLKGKQPYCAFEGAVEADWSQAGFYYAALGLGNTLSITGMNQNSMQGDRKVADYYKQLCAEGEVELDVGDCPDLVPPLAVQAALRPDHTVTRIVHAERLRMKESDRLSAVREVLNAMGAQVKELSDGLVICGVDMLHGGCAVDAHNDHRIAMMAAMAASRCAESVTIVGAECVKKSYPNFWEDYEALGGKITQEG